MADRPLTPDDDFLGIDDLPLPYTFLQWKGTDICMDFHCECGADCHFDGFFAYCVKCPHCGAIWEMPCHLFPRRADERTYSYHMEHAVVLDSDEEYRDLDGNAMSTGLLQLNKECI